MTNEERIQRSNIIGVQCETEKFERYTISVTPEQAALIKGEWISVNERLPKDGQVILCIFSSDGYIDGELKTQEYNSPCIGKYIEGDKYWFCENVYGDGECKVVTRPAYWLPCPCFSHIVKEE